mmetsp:Transcript_2664/g.4548  ORF Transcript_2664/g.4548 Transcript_2664/m.4548 type:complete len:204 (-) Transcript_2664:712-1323(-)
MSEPYAAVTYSGFASSPVKKTPHMPAKPCMGAALKGSSIRSLRKIQHTPSKIKPAHKPFRMAAQGSITWAHAVTATRPHSTPLQVATKSQAFWRRKPLSRQAQPPAAADRVVHTAERAAIWLAPWEIRPTDPGLNPYQPNQRRTVPSTTKTAECPGMSTGCPLESNRPRRGPTNHAPIMPVKPPTMCTTPEPAKSIMPLPNST